MTYKRGRPTTQGLRGTPTRDQLRAFRERHDLSQAEAANVAGVGMRTWNRWESDGGAMPPSTWHSLLIEIEGSAVSAMPQISGEDIRKERMERGLTLPMAARIAGVTLGAWVRWEMGTEVPSADNWKRWQNWVASDINRG